MKTMKFISAILMTAAMAFAAGESMRPESSIPTPAERSEISRETPDLSATESAEWQKLRAERKQAREQILSRLRESSTAEKQSIRQNLPNNMNSQNNMNVQNRPEGDFQNFRSREREREPFYERPDSRNMNPMRDMPGGPPPEGDRRFH